MSSSSCGFRWSIDTDTDTQRLLKTIGVSFDENTSNDDNSADDTDSAIELLKHMIDCVKVLETVTCAYRKQGSQQNAARKAGINMLRSFSGELGRLLQYTLTTDWDFLGDHNVLEFIEISEIILQSFPDFASRRQKYSGKILLHKAAQQSCRIIVDSTFQTLLRSNPASASISDFLGAIPLHWAMRNSKSSFEVADVLLQSYPEGVSVRDNQGLTPLHWAVSDNNPNVEVVRGLVEVCPEAAAIACDKGNTPLHYCVNRSCVSIPTMVMLLRASPESVKVACEEGWLPVHRCANRAEPDVEALKLLIKAYPEGLLHRNQDGQLPLHKAVDHSFPSVDAISLLLDSCPEAALIADMEGYLPLHLILDCSSPDLVAAEKILEMFPEAASKPTLDGLLPLHFVLASNNEPSVEFVCKLLEVNPHAQFHLAIDYAPEDENADPDTWEGAWKEKHWTPITRALDRGLSEIADLLRSDVAGGSFAHRILPSSPSSSTTSEASSSSSPSCKTIGNKLHAGLTPLNTNFVLQSQLLHTNPRYPFRPFPAVGSTSSVGRTSVATERLPGSWRGGSRATPRSGRCGSSIPSTPGSVRRWARRDQDSDIGSELHALPSADRCFIEEDEDFWGDDDDNVAEFTTVYVEEEDGDETDHRPCHSARRDDHRHHQSFIHAHHNQSNGHTLVDNSRGAKGGTSRASLWPALPSKVQASASPLSGTPVRGNHHGNGHHGISSGGKIRKPLPPTKKSFTFQPLKKGPLNGHHHPSASGEAAMILHHFLSSESATGSASGLTIGDDLC